MPTNRGKSGADQVIAELAAGQHGVVARRQLFAVGLSRGAVDRRLATGRLHTLHQAVYAVGQPRIAGPGRLLAAVLACGDHALLSHRSAAALWELLPYHGSRVNVTAPSCGRRSLRGITSIALAALIGVPRDSGRHPADQRRAERCSISPERSGWISSSGRSSRRSGCGWSTWARLRACASTRMAITDCGSWCPCLPLPSGRPLRPGRSWNAGSCAYVRRAGCRARAVNVEVAGHEVDALWRDRGLVVELDGYAYHRTRAAFERDRVRDADLQRAGLRVIRVTARRLNDDPVAVAETVRSLLEVSESALHADVAEGRAP